MHLVAIDRRGHQRRTACLANLTLGCEVTGGGGRRLPELLDLRHPTTSPARSPTGRRPARGLDNFLTWIWEMEFRPGALGANFVISDTR